MENALIHLLSSSIATGASYYVPVIFMCLSHPTMAEAKDCPVQTPAKISGTCVTPFAVAHSNYHESSLLSTPSCLISARTKCYAQTSPANVTTDGLFVCSCPESTPAQFSLAVKGLQPAREQSCLSELLAPECLVEGRSYSSR